MHHDDDAELRALARSRPGLCTYPDMVRGAARASRTAHENLRAVTSTRPDLSRWKSTTFAAAVAALDEDDPLTAEQAHRYGAGAAVAVPRPVATARLALPAPPPSAAAEPKPAAAVVDPLCGHTRDCRGWRLTRAQCDRYRARVAARTPEWIARAGLARLRARRRRRVILTGLQLAALAAVVLAWRAAR